MVKTCIPLFLAFLVSAAAAGNPDEARLVAETASIRAGTPFTLGMLVDLPEGWHTYWRNPGDAGMAPTLDWHLPDGFIPGPLQWPYPETFGEPGLASFGYSGRMFLSSLIIPPASLPPGEIVLKARLSWLICSNICLPRQANLACSLPVKDAPPAPSEWSPLFEQARARLPIRDPGWTFKARRDVKGLVLAATPPAGLPPDRLGKSLFYGFEPEGMATERTDWDLTGPTGRLILKVAPDAARKPHRLQGVLVLPPEKEGGPKQALVVNVPIEDQEPRTGEPK